MGFINRIFKSGKTGKNDFESPNNKGNSLNEQAVDAAMQANKIKNFGYLDNLIHSGTNEILLDFDIVLEKGEEYSYLDGIKLDIDNILIDGNGHLIDALGKARIFKSTGKNVTLKNITLKNGLTSESGGAIHNYAGELHIIKSSFYENMAKGSGGALYSSSGEVEIRESSFINNSSDNGGGAIENYSGTLTIMDSSLNGNTIKAGKWDGGGAISNYGELEIIKSALNDNKVYGKDDSGGAILNKKDLNIIQSSFANNFVKSGKGGAIFNSGRLTISNSSFSHNWAKENGGSLCNHSEVMIDESTFEYNQSKRDCGAIYSSGELKIANSTIANNKANGNGGAIYNNLGSFELINCQISNNASSKNIIENEDYLNIYNSSFKNNRGMNIIGNDKDKSKLFIYNGEFIDNDVVKSAVFNKGNSCIIENCLFKGNLYSILNKSDLTLISPIISEKYNNISNKGHILIKKSSPDILKKVSGRGIAELQEDLIPEEELFDFGYLDRIIHESREKEIVLENDICFEKYEVDYYEGGILLDIDNLTIDGNGKTIDGAGKSRIFTVTGNKITLKNIIFKNGHSFQSYTNPFNNNGGAIRINRNSDLTIENCIFLNNSSEKNGGAVDNQGNLTIIDSELKENISQEYGGAINNYGDLEIIKSTLVANSADHGYGGAISSCGNLTISKSTINENKATLGAIYNKRNLKINESRFEDNKGFSCGAVYSNANAVIMKSLFANNSASNMRGGAIENFGVMSITESILKGNVAKGYGGAIFNNNDLSLRESSLYENLSKKDGGAIYSPGNLTLTDCVIENNKPNNVRN